MQIRSPGKLTRREEEKRWTHTHTYTTAKRMLLCVRHFCCFLCICRFSFCVSLLWPHSIYIRFGFRIWSQWELFVCYCKWKMYTCKPLRNTFQTSSISEFLSFLFFFSSYHKFLSLFPSSLLFHSDYSHIIYLISLRLSFAYCATTATGKLHMR